MWGSEQLREALRGPGQVRPCLAFSKRQALPSLVKPTAPASVPDVRAGCRNQAGLLYFTHFPANPLEEKLLVSPHLPLLHCIPGTGPWKWIGHQPCTQRAQGLVVNQLQHKVLVHPGGFLEVVLLQTF